MNMGKISGAKVTASWFNPPTGTTQSIGTFDNAGVKEFTCPSEGFGSDWVLVPDDASRNFGATGSFVAGRSLTWRNLPALPAPCLARYSLCERVRDQLIAYVIVDWGEV